MNNDPERGTVLPEEPARQGSAKPRPRRKKGGRIWKWLLLALVVLAVVLALCVRLFPKTFNPDRLARTFRYMGLKDQSGYGEIRFDASSGAFAPFDDGIVTAGENGVTLFSLNGEQKSFAQSTLTTPILRCGEDVSLCFSPGSSGVVAIAAGGEVLMDRTLDGPVLDADVSSDGFIGLITSESGYKSVATVLNRSCEAVFRFSSRTRYLSACAVGAQGKLLALAALAEEEASFHTVITLLDTGVELEDLEQAGDQIPRADLGNRYVYDLFFLDANRICAVCQDELVFLDDKANVLNTLDLSDSQLIDLSRGDREGLVLALGQSSAGESGRILTLDADGDVQAELELRDRILSVSAAGKYVGVLTDTGLMILDRTLQTYHQTQRTHSAVKAAVRPDGTAFFIHVNGATLYIP